MTDMNDNEPFLSENADQMLIDDILGELDEKDAKILRERLESDQALAARREELAKTFGLLDLCDDVEVPDGLSQRTLGWIESVKETNRLIGFEQLGGGYRPTFSLREMLAVAAVLVIAVTVIFSTLNAARQRGWQNTCSAQLGEIGTALQNYAMANSNRLPSASDNATDNWLAPERGRPANSSALYRLLKQEYIRNPQIFQCPANAPKGFQIDRDKADFPDATYVGYSYQHSIGHSVNLDGVKVVIGQFVILADKTPYFQNGRFDPSATVSRNHFSGQGVLYADGHTAWVITSDTGVDDDNIFLVSSAVNSYNGTEKPADINDSFLLPN